MRGASFGDDLHPLPHLGRDVGMVEQQVRLVMPKLGAPVEPSRVESVVPWWQSVRGARVDERSVAGALRG